MFNLEINTDNAAFDYGNAAAEIARILRSCADRLDQGAADVTDEDGIVLQLRDINGNIVGFAETTKVEA